MEMTLDMKGLDIVCTCGSGKLAGNCCKQNETCPCGSSVAVNACCLASTATPAPKA